MGENHRERFLQKFNVFCLKDKERMKREKREKQQTLHNENITKTMQHWENVNNVENVENVENLWCGQEKKINLQCFDESKIIFKYIYQTTQSIKSWRNFLTRKYFYENLIFFEFPMKIVPFVDPKTYLLHIILKFP